MPFRLELLILGFAVWVVLATSQVKVSSLIEPGVYRVTSDCPLALASGQVNLSRSDVSSIEPLAAPAQLELSTAATATFTMDTGLEYGFPSNTLSLYDEQKSSVAISSGTDLSCEGLAFRADTSFIMFSCFEPVTRSMVCTITLTP